MTATQTPASSHAGIADAAMATVRGTTDAQRLIHVLRQGCAPADALHDALQAVLATNDQHRVRGFCREIAKSLERALA